MKRAHYEMYAPWRTAGQGLRTILDLLSRPLGVAPWVSVKRLPTIHGPRELVVHFHASAHLRDQDDAAKLADGLVGRGAIVQWWEMPGGHVRRRGEIADGALAVWAVQIRAAEVEATIAHNDGVRARRWGRDGYDSFQESAHLEGWAADGRAALWQHYGVEP
ncbi:MAG: hypothetical protein Q8P41_18535 [Pseudomonadota bacterium]|nr:hypothetical protein [Pseudomonadota bacterium]